MTIVSIADHPDLAPTVASWLWHAFSRDDDRPLADIEALVAAATCRQGVPQCFVLLADGIPVGTASLARHDLDERPDLTPWLAGVLVLPQARGRGYARQLVAAVETACAASAIPTAWLYTHTAEPLYARAGWRRVEIVKRAGKPDVSLMRKDFASDQ